jgi:hypothetical protein
MTSQTRRINPQHRHILHIPVQVPVSGRKPGRVSTEPDALGWVRPALADVEPSRADAGRARSVVIVAELRAVVRLLGVWHIPGDFLAEGAIGDRVRDGHAVRVDIRSAVAGHVEHQEVARGSGPEARCPAPVAGALREARAELL